MAFQKLWIEVSLYQNIFVVWLAALLRPHHSVAEGQTVACWKYGSVVHLCQRVLNKMMMLHYRFAPRMSNTNAQFWSSFCNSYPAVSKNCCLSTHQVLFICELGGLLCLSVSTTLVWMLLNVDPLVHISLWQKSSVLAWQSIAPFHSFIHQKMHYFMFLALVRTCIGEVIFMLCSFNTSWRQLNCTHSMSLSDLELQCD